MVKLSADENGFYSVGIYANKELTDGVGNKSNNNKDEYSVGSVVIGRYGLYKQIGNNDIDDDHGYWYECI